MLQIQVKSKWASQWLPPHLLKLGLHHHMQLATLINMLMVNIHILSSTILSKATTLSNSTTGLREHTEDIILLLNQEHHMLTTTLTNITITSITIIMVLVHIHNNINNNNQFKYKRLLKKKCNHNKKVKMSK